VIVADVEAARASRASQFGASQTFCLGGDGPAELLRMAQHATDGRGADVVLEMSGAPSSVEHAASYCRIGGCLVLVGSVFPARPVAWNPEQIVRRLLRIEGVHNYRPEDLAEALRFLVRAQDRYPLADLVAKTFSLEDVEQAFRYAVDSRAIRIAVVP
jgi:alcohol dehydrogenase